MRNFYGQAGTIYMRKLVLYQTLFFVLLLIAAILWALDQVNVLPGSPWTIHVLSWLVLLVLAAWIVMLSSAVPGNPFAAPQRAKVFVALVMSGAITTSLLVLFLPGGSIVRQFLVIVPVVLAALVACAASSVYFRRLIKRQQASMQRYETDQAKLGALKTRYGAEAVTRVELSHALEFGHESGNPVPGPTGYVIAGITSKPWYDVDDFPWARRLEESFKDIREELGELLTNKNLLGRYPYFDKQGWGAEGWDAFRFVEKFQLDAEKAQRFPKTAEFLKTVPRFPVFRDAMFSVLTPGTRIPPHRDGSNIYLTCHLGLVIPDGCKIRVGGQTRTWEEGKCIIFDSSYEHEALNTSDQTRIVLLIDFLHPELTDIEAEWVAAKETALFS